MGRAIICLAPNEYVMWSSIVDAPIGHIRDRTATLEMLSKPDEADDWSRAMAALPEQADEIMARIDERGHSYRNLSAMSIQELIAANRAGPREESLTLAAIRERYASPQAMASFELTADKVLHYDDDQDDDLGGYCLSCRRNPCLNER